MKRKTKIAIFILILALSSNMLSFIFTPSSYMRVVLHEVKMASDDSPYDMVILGQSRGETNINPYVLNDYIDYNSYNLSRRILRMSDLYYLASEVNCNNKLKVIILDVDHVYWTDSQISYYSDAYLLPNIEGLNNKLDYFFRYTITSDYRVLFSRYAMHGSEDIRTIPNRVKEKLSSDYWEYSMDAVGEKDADHIYIGRGFHRGISYSQSGNGAEWNREMIDDTIVNDVKRLVDYCNDNGIRVIAVHDPVPHERFSNEQHADMNAYFADEFKEMGVEFINFNYVRPEYLSWDECDFSDGEGHMMGDFADKYSEILGKMITLVINGEDISSYFYE